MTAVAQVRQDEAGHPDQAVHVRLQHDLLVGLARVVERVAAEREPGVVDEHVHAAELLHGRRDETFAAGRVGDVELERDVGVHPFDAPRAARDARPLRPERPHDRGADPARGAGDDRRLALEQSSAS